jgi:hypothetical protein
MPQTPSRSPTPPAALPTVVIKANDFHVDAKAPCRLMFVIPLELPPLLDPSIPPPPYYPPDNTIDRPALRDSVMTALRPAVIGALYELLGPEAAVASMIPRENGDWRQKEEYVSRGIADRSKFELETGYWMDQYGVEGYEIQAYIDYGMCGIGVIEGYKIRVDQNIEDNKSNPLIVEVKAMPVLHQGKVAFVARKYRHAEQEALNHSIWQEEW